MQASETFGGQHSPNIGTLQQQLWPGTATPRPSGSRVKSAGRSRQVSCWEQAKAASRNRGQAGCARIISGEACPLLSTLKQQDLHMGADKLLGLGLATASDAVNTAVPLHSPEHAHKVGSLHALGTYHPADFFSTNPNETSC